MTGDGIDKRMDRLVKAGWLAIGLSQTDLAEVLGAALQPNRKDGKGPNGIGSGRLMQVAEALDIPIDSFQGHTIGAGQEERELSSADTLNSLQSLLELRLLRAFHEIEDQRTKRMLVQLAEKIVKRQANRRGDAG
jgi:transcriptional regulator with XRE-family HTH domain